MNTWQPVDIIGQTPARGAYPARPVTAINGIAIHHSADRGDPWSWARYHTTTPAQGGPSWGPAPGVAYHCAVMRDGTVYRLHPDTAITWHVAGHNTHLIGIVLQGDLTQQRPAPAQLAGLFRAVQYYRAYAAITPDRIRGHGEWQGSGTTCPGLWLGAFGLAYLLRSLDW